MSDYLEKGIQTPMAQGRSTKIISMIKWSRTSRLSTKNSLSLKRAIWSRRRRRTCRPRSSQGARCARKGLQELRLDQVASPILLMSEVPLYVKGVPGAAVRKGLQEPRRQVASPIPHSRGGVESSF